MRRYFFHVIRGDAVCLQDEVGIELPSDEVAVQQGAIAAAEVAQEEGLSTRQIDTDGFRIVDESGRPVATLPFRDLHTAGKIHSVVTAVALLGLQLPGFPQYFPKVLAEAPFC